MNQAITRATADAPWKGTHNGRWWTLDADDVESAARTATKGATVRVLCALLNVSKATHPKALKARAVLTEAGVPWPCE